MSKFVVSFQNYSTLEKNLVVMSLVSCSSCSALNTSNVSIHELRINISEYAITMCYAMHILPNLFISALNKIQFSVLSVFVSCIYYHIFQLLVEIVLPVYLSNM